MDGDVRRALGLFDREGQHLPSLDHGEVALFGIAVGDLRDVRQADRAAVADRDARLAKLEGVGRVADDLRPAERQVEVVAAIFVQRAAVAAGADLVALTAAAGGVDGVGAGAHRLVGLEVGVGDEGAAEEQPHRAAVAGLVAAEGAGGDLRGVRRALNVQGAAAGVRAHGGALVVFEGAADDAQRAVAHVHRAALAVLEARGAAVVRRLGAGGDGVLRGGLPVDEAQALQRQHVVAPLPVTLVVPLDDAAPPLRVERHLAAAVDDGLDRRLVRVGVGGRRLQRLGHHHGDGFLAAGEGDDAALTHRGLERLEGAALLRAVAHHEVRRGGVDAPRLGRELQRLTGAFRVAGVGGRLRAAATTAQAQQPAERWEPHGAGASYGAGRLAAGILLHRA